MKLIDETKPKNRAILKLFLKRTPNARVEKATIKVMNKITKATIFNSPCNNDLQYPFYYLKLKCQEKF